MISILGSNEDGSDVMIKMADDSEPVKIVIAGEKDLTCNDFVLRVNGQKVPLINTGDSLIIKTIDIEPGIYQFELQMSGERILSGYYERL